MTIISQIISLFLSLLAMFNTMTPASVEEKEYPMTTQVVCVDYENDIVVCQDFNGNLWEFSGCEDWMYGDIASMIMNDKGTPTIYDDEIVSVRYDGYFDGFPKG